MLPIGQLMIEHRLIERVIALMDRARGEAETNREINPPFLRTAADFMTNYADRCHHGKEEGILFRRLEGKPLAEPHQEMLRRLLEEHKLARRKVAALKAATESFTGGDPKALCTITRTLRDIVEMYPAHIIREDTEFFRPCMGYFSPAERDQMVQDFAEFDRHLVHETYQVTVAGLENRWAATPA